MGEFTVGDRVTFSDEHGTHHGEVRGRKFDVRDYFVEFDDGDTGWFFEEELESEVTP